MLVDQPGRDPRRAAHQDAADHDVTHVGPLGMAEGHLEPRPHDGDGKQRHRHTRQDRLHVLHHGVHLGDLGPGRVRFQQGDPCAYASLTNSVCNSVSTPADFSWWAG